VVRGGKTDDLFRFLSGKYRLRKDLWITSGYGESTLRPDQANLSGRATINDAAMTGNIPNPSLKPEHATKSVARLEFYFEPAGTLSVGYFVNDLRDRQVQTTQIPAEDIGLGGTYPGYLFTTTVNRGDLKIDGFEVEYRQRFTFLPGLWKGLGAVASYTKNRFSDEALAASTSPALANGGLMYSHRRIIASLLATWTDDTLVTSGTLVRYRKARTLLDASLSVRLFGEVRFFVNARNLTNAPIETYENVPTRIWKYQHFGTGYTFGLSGSY
jgi:iron complex outermembrane receptor protein